MRTPKYITMIFLLAFVVSCARSTTKPSVDIVIDKNGTKIEKFAAAELSSYLSKIYPSYNFPVRRKSNGNKSIFMTVDKNAEGLPESEEGYIVKSQGDNAYILSKSDTGLIYGVYGLLEKLGCGFYISEECLPAAREIFSFDGWELTDEPLVKDRYVFNWHNFISGCTGWDKKHWLQWVDRSQKMGYNAVMVHAYFNNPMHTYSFKGIEKENGYYTTSAIGREWGNIPVNDVRRLVGGEIFDSAVIGSEVASIDYGPDAKTLQDAKSIQKMMRETFSYATGRGVDVCFAFDMDISLQHLQKSFVSKIAAADKFAVCKGSMWIPKPWTDEGMAFYKAQIDGLLSSYPMLTQIACWRRGSSWFAGVSPEELPAEWKKQYDDHLAKNEVLKTIGKGELMSSFITSRFVLTYQQVLKDMGRSDVEITTGTWGVGFVVPTAVFLPEEIKLMPIDWNVRFNNSLINDQKISANFEEYANRRVIPFLWSHHDDGQYIGRCYKPADELYSKLNKAAASGIGVFHWMNRPQDIYFKSLQRQVWARTVDEPCQDTCNKMAQDYWGSEELGPYIMDWLTDAPIFGRATAPNMHHRPWKECKFPEGTRANVIRRLEYLNSVDTSAMTSPQKGRLEYFKLLETFMMQFIGTQRHLDNAEKFLAEGKLAQAQDELRKGYPEQAVKTYAKLSCTPNEDRGEMAYVVSLATKWIGDYDSFRQRARLIPIQVKLGRTIPEDIAQGRVGLWYFIDKNGKFWEKLGNEISGKNPRHSNVTAIVKHKATGKETFVEDVFLEGIELGRARIPIRPIMRAAGVKNSSHVSKGKYLLKTFASSEKGGSFSIEVGGISKSFTVKGDRVLELAIELKDDAVLQANAAIIDGNVVLCGLILEPVAD